MTTDKQLSITSLSIDEAATVLSRSAKRRITAEMIQADIAAGLPTKKVAGEIKINLIVYGAWLNKIGKKSHG